MDAISLWAETWIELPASAAKRERKTRRAG
jgi:hypothetical protein